MFPSRCRNDIAGAMECVKECQTKYKLMPHFHEILIKLVEEGDTEQLQKGEQERALLLSLLVLRGNQTDEKSVLDH